ncbi:hypothetical protein CDD81_1763 [Ophiocordyceps australis]|uniref:Methyltransferase domain-containing protein n=1 Tax=Ophiocordyceps australis TaxID=1399860 RepID=A0A2C5YAE4_9HYPO|nr:hypothetical protein CDD81_1763 [Ophiocordyceps australis]
MASVEKVKSEYDAQAEGYNDISHLPCNILESELIEVALGDCTGLNVLDFGGGSGLHARQAVDAGAACVDIIDLSTSMLRVAQETEKKLGRSGKIRCFEADVTKPLDHLGLREEYDLVMSNFCFDHATTHEQLEAMWRNAVSRLKPGGRFVGARVGNMKSLACTSGIYGVTYKDFQDIPGGVRYRYRMNLTEPIEFEACSLLASYSGNTEMHKKFGLTDIDEVPFEKSKAIRENPDFWKVFLDDPSMAVVMARKGVAV